jgi:membrane protein
MSQDPSFAGADWFGVKGQRTLRGVRRLPFLLRKTVANGWRDRVLGLSAEAAFWQLLSLPSLFLAFVATLGYVSRWFGDQTPVKAEHQIESTLAKAFSPQVVNDVVTPMLHEVLNGGRADIISIGFVVALWAGSSATATFVNTITIAYGMRDLRGAVRSRLLALWLFLGSVAIGVVALPMLVIGPNLLEHWLPRRLNATFGPVINAGYYPVVTVLLLLGLTTLFHLAPPRRLPWRRGVPGALLAIAVFLAGSTGLRAYISFVLQRTHAYGTIAAPIAALLFFFVLALGVLLGAEFNACIQQEFPARTRKPRVLRSGNWQRLGEPGDQPPVNGVANGHARPAGRLPRLTARSMRRGDGQRERLS